jgi:broad specificity phosphatase PhoE
VKFPVMCCSMRAFAHPPRFAATAPFTTPPPRKPNHPPPPPANHPHHPHQQLSSERFSRLFVSPLRRARQTAEAIAGMQPFVPPPAAAASGGLGDGAAAAAAITATLADAAEVLPSLREIDLYAFQGLLKARGKARHGPAYAVWQCAPEQFELRDDDDGGRGDDGQGRGASAATHAPVRELWHRASLAWREILRDYGPDGDNAKGEGDDDDDDAAAALLVVAHNAVNQALVGAALGLGPRHFRRLLQTNGAATVLDFGAASSCREEEEVGGGAAATPPPARAALDRLNETAGDALAKALAKADAGTAARVVLVRAAPAEAGGETAAAAEATRQLADDTLSPALSAGARLARVAYAPGDADAERLAWSLAAAAPVVMEEDADLLSPPRSEPRRELWQRAGRAWRRALAAGRLGGGGGDVAAANAPPALVVVVASSAETLAAMVGHALAGCEEEEQEEEEEEQDAQRAALGGALRLDRGGVTVVDVSASAAAPPRAVVRALNVGGSRPIARAGEPLPPLPSARE